MTTEELPLTDDWQQVTTQVDFMVQCIKGTAKVVMNDIAPTVDTKYKVLTLYDVLPSTIVTCTMWAKKMPGISGDVILSVTE